MRSSPPLDPGLTRLRADDAPAALYRLVVDALARRDGTALWVDARNRADSYALYEAAEDRPTVLDDLRIARAFTAYQHHTLVRNAVAEVTPETDLLVVPRLAALYRDDDVPGGEARALLRSTLATLTELADSADVAVLVTCRETGPDGATTDPSADTDRLAAMVADAVDHGIRVESTRFGYRFDAPGFETRAYADLQGWQTTIPYWVDLFGSVPAFDRGRAVSPALHAALWESGGDAVSGPTTPGDVGGVV
jgi:hypothetical protein